MAQSKSIEMIQAKINEGSKKAKVYMAYQLFCIRKGLEAQNYNSYLKFKQYV